MSKQEKKKQLGMDPATASYRLVRDLLWSFVVKNEQDFCHHCKCRMTRENFSIEHIKPWLHSDDPLGLFFDLNNISFSHSSCNSSAARRPNKVHDSLAEAIRVRSKRRYWNTPKEIRKQKRREQYLRTGK